MVQYNRDTTTMHRCNTDAKSVHVIDLEDHNLHHKESFSKQLRNAKKEHDTTVSRSSKVESKSQFEEIIISVDRVVEAAADAISSTLDQVNEQLRTSEPVTINKEPMQKAEKVFDETERKVQEFKQNYGEQVTRGNESY